MLKILGIRNQIGHNRNNFFLLQDLWDLFWDTSELVWFNNWGLKSSWDIFTHMSHSVQFSRSVMSDSLQPQGPQHTRPPCPSPTPGAHPNYVHRVDDAIQPSHPLSSPSPPAPNPSQHQGLFQWVNSSHEVAKVLEFQLQHQSFQWTPRTDLL